MASTARRRSGSGPGGAQWVALSGAVLVILGLTFALGLLVGRQWARQAASSAVAGVAEPAKKPAAAPRRSGIAAETMADRAPESTEKLTFYKTLTEPLDGPSAAPKPEAKPVAIKIPPATPSSQTSPAPPPAPPPPRWWPSRRLRLRPRRHPRCPRLPRRRLTVDLRTGGVRGPFLGPCIQTMPQRALQPRTARPRHIRSRSAPTRTAARPTTRDSSSPVPGWMPMWSHSRRRMAWPATVCGSVRTAPGRRRPQPPSGSGRSAR